MMEVLCRLGQEVMENPLRVNELRWKISNSGLALLPQVGRRILDN